MKDVVTFPGGGRVVSFRIDGVYAVNYISGKWAIGFQQGSPDPNQQSAMAAWADGFSEALGLILKELDAQGIVIPGVRA